MKKFMLLSAILVIFCFKLQSQIQLISASTLVCWGDSITSEFTWDNKPGVTNFRIDYVTQSTVIGAHIWSKDNKDFYSLTKKLQGTDTIYTIKLKTPNQLTFGRVAFKTQEQNKVFFIEVNCGPVGIEQYELNATEAIYYDLSGNKVDPSPGKLLIRQIGIYRTKVIIQ